jgi:hypothetical protein
VEHRHASSMRCSTPGALAPVWVILSQSILAYRPRPPHSWARRDFPAEPVIRDAFAVRQRLGDPRVVPRFCCSFLSRHVVLHDPGESVSCIYPVPSPTTQPSPILQGLGTLDYPTNPLQVGPTISGLSIRLCYNLSSCLPPSADPTRLLPSRPRLLLPGFRRVVSLPAAGYNYGGNWASSTGGSFTRWNGS